MPTTSPLERLADGEATNAERRAAALSVTRLQDTDPNGLWVARGAASCAVGVPASPAAERSSDYAAHGYGWCVTAVTHPAGQVDENERWAARLQAICAEQVAQVPLLRDIFGNPFRPVTFSPAWRTDTALTLARQMYESRDFSAMPILADALQDAGCDSAEILDHCRGPGPHVRGCWVVDLVLGKQ